MNHNSNFQFEIKGKVHPKMYILSLFSHNHFKEHLRSQLISIMTNTIYQKGNKHSHVKRKLG